MVVDYREAMEAADFGGFMKIFGPRTYFKEADNRTIPVREGRVFDEIDAEYEALRQHHDIVPENIPEPYAAAIDADGDMTGYWMEEIEGNRMDQYRFSANPNTVDVNEVKKDLKNLVQELHAEGSFHGDISLSNMFYQPEEDRIILFDPVGTCEDDDIHEQLQEKDRIETDLTVDNLEEEVHKAREDGVVVAGR